MSFLIGSLTAVKMWIIKISAWQPVIRMTQDPEKIQNELLLKILKNNSQTTFGQEQGFKNISSYESYRSRVPVASYESLRNYVERQESERSPYLNKEQPVMYAQTSGTTGKPKYIPILKSTIDQYRKSQHIVAYAIYENIPGTFSGKVLAISSPAVEGHLDSGTPYGAMSGLIYQSMPALMRAKYVLPVEVFDIENYREKYRKIAKLALIEKNITLIATANPSTIVKLDQVINQQAEQLINEIRIDHSNRANELEQIYKATGQIDFADIWPNLKTVTTWTGGNCGVLIPDLVKKFPKNTRIVELGYLSSEFRGTITIDVIGNKQIPTLHENFFEFVEKNNWENGVKTFLTLCEVKQGLQYYVFATTQNGLYRYDINDLIEVTGWFNNTPTIRFVQKGKGVTNLTGEKLYEEQLVRAMTEVMVANNFHSRFFIMLACPDNLQYTLYIEDDEQAFVAEEIEQNISNLNIEFEAKRSSERLKPIKITFLKSGAGEAYKESCIENGQREGQFKMSYLQYAKDCSFSFSNYSI